MAEKKKEFTSIQDIDLHSPEKEEQEEADSLEKLERERKNIGKKLMKSVE